MHHCNLPRNLHVHLRERRSERQAYLSTFVRYRTRIGTTGSGKVFHSFRHTFADRLKQANAPHPYIEALLGHADPSLITDKAYTPAVLAPSVALLSFTVQPRPFL